MKKTNLLNLINVKGVNPCIAGKVNALIENGKINLDNTKVTLSDGNSKIGNLYNFNLPAITTCVNNAECKNYCYACKGTYLYPNTISCYYNNLIACLNDLEVVKTQLLEMIPILGAVRIHASGDFYNMQYFNMWVEIASRKPTTRFLAFTKNYNLVNKFIANGGVIPSNMVIVFSYDTNFSKINNPYNLPVTYVRTADNCDRIPKTSIECGGHCDTCFTCWLLNKGQSVVFNKH